MGWMYAIDPATGDYLLDPGGRLVKTTDPTPALVRAIRVPLASFFSDPDDGSRIPELLAGRPRSPGEFKIAIQRAARDALRRLRPIVTVRAIAYDHERRTLTIDTEEHPQSIEVRL